MGASALVDSMPCDLRVLIVKPRRQNLPRKNILLEKSLFNRPPPYL